MTRVERANVDVSFLVDPVRGRVPCHQPCGFGRSQRIVEEADDTDEETDFHFDPSFEEVPFEWLELCRWNVSGCGRWTRRENILVLEARAWMKCVQRLCKGVHGTTCRQLVWY